MRKYLFLFVLLTNVAGASVPVFEQKHLVGKWQCQFQNEPSVKQSLVVQFAKNGTMKEQFVAEYGDKKAYEYQTERATAQADWAFQDELLSYRQYKILSYAVRMPNAKDDDVVQAGLAVQKSLPIIDQMLKKSVQDRHFGVLWLDKKNIVLNDLENQVLITCQKKFW